MEELKDLIDSYDSYYEMSDMTGVFRAGKEKDSLIYNKVKELGYENCEKLLQDNFNKLWRNPCDNIAKDCESLRGVKCQHY